MNDADKQILSILLEMDIFLIMVECIGRSEPGKGTTFSVTIPDKQAKSLMQHEGRAYAKGTCSAGTKTVNLL